jgi:phosphoribosyl 1,2-cyclic phosphodiesterase
MFKRYTPRFIAFDPPFSCVVGNDLYVLAFTVPHDSVGAVGYYVQAGDQSLAVVTDCGNIPDEVGAVIAQADILLIEANHDEDLVRAAPRPAILKDRILSDVGHLSNVKVAAFARRHQPKSHTLVLLHLSMETNHPELARGVIAPALAPKTRIVTIRPGQPSEWLNCAVPYALAGSDRAGQGSTDS